LAQVLRLLPPATDPNVLVGITTADDAAVYRISDDLALVLTADYVTPIVDDPYDFGRIAVTNALSDIYAMGAKPVIGLNLVGFPARTLPLDILQDILRGGVDQARRAGVSIVGGHSIDDPEPKYGLAALGFVHPDRVISNASAKEGDVLFLTKPIGTGIVSTAIKEEAAPAAVVERATALMTTLNKEASEAMAKVSASACTDVTGFGLLGHLYEMTRASKVGARIRMVDVPVIEGVHELLAQDFSPGGARRNLDFVTGRGGVVWDGEFSDLDKLLLADPQTAGGLLISVPEAKAAELQSELAATGTLAARIGEMIHDSEGRIWVT
jgi:selenide,water dikinase